MFNVGAIVGELKLDTAQWQKGMTNAYRNITDLTGKFSGAGVNIVATMGDIYNATKGIVNIMGSFTKAALENQSATVKLADAMKIRGIYTKENIALSLQFSNQLLKLTGIEDEQLNIVQSLLIRRGAEGEMIKDLTKVTLDFATVQQMDVVSAAELVSKAISSDSNVLSRYGIEITGAAASTERMTSVVNGLNAIFGGATVALASSVSGQMKIMKARFGEIKESIGTGMIPVLQALIQITDQQMLPSLEQMVSKQSNINKISDTTIQILKALASGAAYVGYGFKVTGDNIAYVGAVINEDVNIVRQAIEMLKHPFSASEAEANSMLNSFARLKELDKEWLADMSQTQKNLSKIIASINNVRIPDYKIPEPAGKTIQMETEWEDMTPDMNEYFKAMSDAYGETTLEAFNFYAEQSQIYTSQTANTMDAYYNLQSMRIQNNKTKELESASAKYMADKERIEKTITDETKKTEALGELEEAYLAQKQNIEDEYRKKDLEARKKMKPFLIAEAMSNTALGVTKALASAFPPFNFIQAALVAAQGAFQVATIKAQHFAMGGEMKSNGGYAVVGELGPEIVELPGGSRVHSNQESQTFGRNIKITIHNTIQALDPSSVTDASIDRLINRIVSPLKTELSR